MMHKKAAPFAVYIKELFHTTGNFGTSVPSLHDTAQTAYDHSSLVRQMLAYNTGTIVGGGLILATILSTFCQSRWTLRPIVLLGLIFLTLGFGIKTLLQGYQLNTERQHHETVVRKMKAQQSDMLQRVLQLEQSM